MSVDYQAVVEVVERTAGADLAGHLVGRLALHVDEAIVRHGLSGPEDYAAALEVPGPEGRRWLDALMATVLVHETYFYRFASQLEALERHLLATLEPGHRRPLRIWSAGCSRGPEAYTLAMLAHRALRRAGTTVELEVLGTDICGAFVDDARRGIYDEGKLRELPKPLRDRYLEPAGPPGRMRVKDELRRAMRFEHHNLLSPPPGRRFDIVACRNVLMYLRPEAFSAALKNLAASLTPDGALLVGHSESLRGAAQLFQPHREVALGVYRRASSYSTTPVAPSPPTASSPALPPQRPRPKRPQESAEAPSTSDNERRIYLEGDLDSAADPEVLTRLTARLSARLDGAMVEVDVDGATYLDQAVASVIARAARAIEAQGGRLVVIATRSGPRRWAERHRLPLEGSEVSR